MDELLDFADLEAFEHFLKTSPVTTARKTPDEALEKNDVKDKKELEESETWWGKIIRHVIRWFDCICP